jgi:hypothetical protein
MKKLISLLVTISFVFVFGSCSLIGVSSTTTSGPVSSDYPDGIVYKIKVSNETYLCTSFKVSNTDSEISILLNEVYSMSSDGKITWIGQEKVISAVTIEKVTK